MKYFIKNKLLTKHNNIDPNKTNQKWFDSHGFSDEYSHIIELTSFLPYESSFKERLYCILNDIYELKLCNCGKKIPMRTDGRKGYQKFCSVKCLSNSKNIIKKRMMTNNFKYGGLACNTEETVKKIEKTNFKRYGVRKPFQSEAIIKKVKDNNLKKYGTEYTLTLTSVRKKLKATNHKKSFKKLTDSDKFEPLFNLNEYNGSRGTYNWKCKKCGDEFTNNNKDLYYLRCFNCNPRLAGTSRGEQEVANFCQYVVNKLTANKN